MSYREIRTTQNEEVRARYTLCMERIAGIPDEVPATPEGVYFQKTASVIGLVQETLSQWEADALSKRDLAACREWNAALYHDLNMLQPFREGNGRTERLFLTLLVRNAGYEISFAGCDRDLLTIAAIRSAQGDMTFLQDTLDSMLKTP